LYSCIGDSFNCEAHHDFQQKIILMSKPPKGAVIKGYGIERFGKVNPRD